MVKQVAFIWTGTPGVYGKRSLTGSVLEQRARRDGGTDFLVKSPELALSKWVNAEFCTVLPEVVVTVEKPEPVAAATQWELVDVGPVKLTRVTGGYQYVIGSKLYDVFQRGNGDGWQISNRRDAYDYSDPLPTLRVCREALAEMRTSANQKAAVAAVASASTAA